MAVVIQQPDALGALNDTAAGYVQGKDKALALSMAREKEANDQRNKTRQLDLQQQQTESEVRSRDASTQIAQEQHTYEQSIRPMLERLSQAQLDGTLKQNDVLEATLQGHKIDNDTKARLAKLGIPEKQAEAILQETRQQVQTSIAQQHAAESQQKTSDALRPGEVKQQGATLEATQASTKASLHQANAPYYQPQQSTGANYNNDLTAYAALSPQGRSIVDAVKSGKMTDRAGALAAQKLGKEAPKVIAELSNLDSDPAAKKDVNAVTPQQRATDIRGGISTLASQGIKMPSDPHFGAILKSFEDPSQKAAVLADPHMPQATRSYLQQLDAMVP